MPKSRTELMREKRAAYKAAGFKDVNTHIHEDIIAVIDAEQKTRRLLTRGDAIAALVTEWGMMKSTQEEHAA